MHQDAVHSGIPIRCGPRAYITTGNPGEQVELTYAIPQGRSPLSCEEGQPTPCVVVPGKRYRLFGRLHSLPIPKKRAELEVISATPLEEASSTPRPGQ